jgi:hypothetical protein
MNNKNDLQYNCAPSCSGAAGTHLVSSDGGGHDLHAKSSEEKIKQKLNRAKLKSSEGCKQVNLQSQNTKYEALPPTHL